MYNQFTALDQRPLQMNKIILNPMQLPKANKKKKKKVHSKNPYKIKKIKLLGEQGMSQKSLDGLLLLKLLHAQHPKQIITANISYKRIIDINADHLEYFSNLKDLNCSENYISLQCLRKLPEVQHINISHNQIKTINMEHGGFDKLNKLNLSFNFLQYQYINHLTMINNLQDLDLSYNQLEELPENMENFIFLKKLNLQGNRFRSDYKASNFWASLASLPALQLLSVSRNKIRGIHTQKLLAGNFSTLLQLDFSYNMVQNQHNLICARNFSALKKLYITGNPFIDLNQYKGLQMQIYARTGAQVIIQKVNPYYLKGEKVKKPMIRFQKIVKVKNDAFFKKKNVLFGIQMPKQQELFSSDSQDQQQVVESSQEEEDETSEPMFVTEQVQNSKKKSRKTAKKLEEVSENGSQNKQVDESNSRSIIEQNYQNTQNQKSLNQSKYSKNSKGSIDYGEFHKVAAELFGNQKQYKKSFDIHTSYKALKKALDRAGDDF